MSPIPSSDSAPIWSRIVRESIFDDTWNATRVGMFALIRPVITSTDGRCVARIRWMPAARAFCARRAISSSIFLPATIIRSASSSITTTISGSVDSGSGSSGVSENGLPIFFPSLRVADLLVEAREVAHADGRHQPVAFLHLADAPVQCVRREFHVGDDRREQVRDPFVDRQLEHLRVDHDQSHVLGCRLVQQRQDHRVDRDRLARAGRARDEHVRRLREIGDDRVAGDVLAHRDRQLRRRVLVRARLENFRQADHLALRVRQFEAHAGLAGNRLDDADRREAEAARQVLHQPDDLAAAHAERGFDLSA